MRARPLASLIWLLVPAFLGLFPLHTAFGAALTWKQLPEKETLVFKFERILPKVEPRQRGLTQILIPIPWSFWQKERKPLIPDFTTSAIMKAVTITQDGIVIQTQNDGFILSSSANSKRKELTLVISLPVKNENPEVQGGSQALTADAGNGTSATAPPDPVNATQGDAPPPRTDQERRCGFTGKRDVRATRVHGIQSGRGSA